MAIDHIPFEPPARPTNVPAAPPDRVIDNVELTIDGTAVSVPVGSTILEAAGSLGIDTPTLCYVENLTPVNVCRVCVVEVTGSRVLAPACSRKVEAGMEVQTDSERVRHSRKLVLELLGSSVDLSLAGPVAPDGDLARYADRYGADATRFGPPAPAAAPGERDARQPGHHHEPGAEPHAETVAQPVKVDNDLYVRDYSRCILCYKCVEACGEDAQNTFAISVAGRGFDARISTEFDVPLPESACVYCGNCIGVCPTGALMFRSEHEMRAADTWAPEAQTVTDTICPYCGVGCTLSLHVQDNRIVKVTSPMESSVTSGHLCVKGRFGFEFVQVLPEGLAARVTLLLAGIAVLALVEFVVNRVIGPQVGPPALLAAFEPHLLAIGAVCGALALLLTINERTPQASRIRVIAIAVIVVALVRVGGEWWSPGDNRARGEPSPSETRLAVLSWNLESGSKSPQDVIDGILAVRQPLRPQVVALQELTPDVATALEASDEIDQRFPYRVLEPRDGVRGMGILSSIPLEEGAYGAFPMLLTASLILPDGSTLDLVNAHPLPPKISTLAGVPIGLDTRQRDLDLRYVRAAADRAADEERVLLVGDLNTTPFEAGFGIVADGLHDVHAEVATGTGFTWRPAFLEALDAGLLRIDHVLAGAALQPVAITEDCSLPGDHCRVTAVVDVPDAD